MFDWKNVFALALMGTMLYSAPAGAAEPVAGMPNPMVPYADVETAKAEAGFIPLYLSSLSGYHMHQVWVIDGDVIEVEYVSDSQPGGRFNLRTARCTELMYENISGIHGAKWEQHTINGLSVAVADIPAAKDSANGYAAHWQHNNMLFSVSATNVTYREFCRLLEKGLVELTKVYF